MFLSGIDGDSPRMLAFSGQHRFMLTASFLAAVGAVGFVAVSLNITILVGLRNAEQIAQSRLHVSCESHLDLLLVLIKCCLYGRRVFVDDKLNRFGKEWAFHYLYSDAKGPQDERRYAMNTKSKQCDYRCGGVVHSVRQRIMACNEGQLSVHKGNVFNPAVSNSRIMTKKQRNIGVTYTSLVPVNQSLKACC